MKKVIVGVVTALTLLTSSNASAQAVEQGNIIIDAYYGFPNLYTAVFKSAYSNSAGTLNYAVKGLGPLGLRAEYMLADKFGMGLDIGFNKTLISYDEQSGSNTYTYEFATQKLGIMATFNYHFLDNDKVDLYGVLGVGYGSRTFDFTSTDPNYTNTAVESLIPVASKLGIGMRYFLTDNIGINVAAGFGQGGLLNAGLSAKF
jgi:opacity protein-like surface antigen